MVDFIAGKYHRGERVEGQWVFGGVERDTGKCFLEPVENRSAQTLMTLIEEWILPGSIIISDSWKSYSTIKYYLYKIICKGPSKIWFIY